MEGIQVLHEAILQEDAEAAEHSGILLDDLKFLEGIRSFTVTSASPAIQEVVADTIDQPRSNLADEQPPQPAKKQSTTRAWRRAQGPKSPVFMKPAKNP